MTSVHKSSHSDTAPLVTGSLLVWRTVQLRFYMMVNRRSTNFTCMRVVYFPSSLPTVESGSSLQGRITCSTHGGLPTVHLYSNTKNRHLYLAVIYLSMIDTSSLDPVIKKQPSTKCYNTSSAMTSSFRH